MDQTHPICTHRERGLANLRFTGPIDPPESPAAFPDFLRGPNFARQDTTLTDVRGVTKINATCDDMVLAMQQVVNAQVRFDRDLPSIIPMRDEMAFVFAQVLDEGLKTTSRTHVQGLRDESEAFWLAGCLDTLIEELARCGNDPLIPDADD